MAKRSTKTTAETEVAESKGAAKAEEAAAKKKPGRKPAVKAEDPIAEASTKTSAKKKSGTEFVLQIQYSGKSYTQEELRKIAGDVWKYDLKQEEEDLTSVELYVKPEENKVYYVMNKEFTGSFNI